MGLTFPQHPADGKTSRDKAYVNYSRSLAAYSVIQYVLAIRDRHNGNIMIDDEGHLIHCDFGFMLTNAPGNVYFEPTSFKLTEELTDVLGGSDSKLFQQCRRHIVDGMVAVRRHLGELVTIIEL